MSTTSIGGKFSRQYEFIGSRRERLIGLGGLDRRVICGFYVDARGRRRKADLVQLGSASDLAGAIRLAECGLERAEPGSSDERAYRVWLRQLLATRDLAAQVDLRYRAAVAERCAGLPAHGDPVAIAAE